MSDLGRYRIQTVSEMTGVSPATLRQWERRYGLPSPNRTDADYRIYGAGDVAQIRRMVALGEQGIAPSEAARILLREAEEQAVAGPPPIATDADPGAPMPDDLDPYYEVRRQLIDAIERYDFERLAELGRTLAYLGSAVTIFERVVAPTMREVGQRWHDGRMSVAQEHMASEVVNQLMHQMLPLVQPDDTDRLAVLACMSDDTHTLPLYGIAFRLAQWGYRSVVLGARTPPSAVASAVTHIRPALIGLSVTIAPPEVKAQQLLQAYGAAAGDVPWLVGGRGARALAQQIPAAGGMIAPGDPAELRALVERLTAARSGARSG